MFANTFQSGFLSIFYSVGSNPLNLWDKQVKNGHIRRVVDDEVRSLVLEISGTNVATTYITCPIKPRLSLGIKLPFLVMIIKNMKKYFTFEIQILDDKDMHRRFRVSNFQSTTKVRPFCTTMPIGLSSGWNQVQFNLADFTKRAYGSTYLETTRVQVHANVRIRRIYFSDVLYTDEELPNEYKLFIPTPGTQSVQRPSQIKTAEKRQSGVEKRDSKKPSVSKDQAVPKSPEEEPPSAAPPSPVGPEENIPATPTSTAEASTVEPPTEKFGEEATTAEPTSEDVTTAEPTTTELTEPPSEPDVEAATGDAPVVEAGDAAAPGVKEAEAPPSPEVETFASAEEVTAAAEEAPTEEVPQDTVGEAPVEASEETPAEAAPEEAPAEEAPKETPAEGAPVEEPPSEAEEIPQDI